MNRGCFISLEGGEGAGKTTQARRLAEWLAAKAIDVITTREPGGSEGAEAIRALLVSGETGRWDAKSEALLLHAARHDHCIRTIEPALARGAWVICDRFSDSTMAYQGYGLGLDLAWIESLKKLALGNFAPDLTFIFDLPVLEGLKRAAVTQRYEKMGIAFHERLRRGYLAIAAQEPERCIVIDAAQPLETVSHVIRNEIANRLGINAHGG